MSLELHEDALSISSVGHEKDPHEFSKIINKTDIVIVATN
jgi:hypothetical protein